MKTRLALALIVVLSLVPPAFAHQLDEYLQATTIAVEKVRMIERFDGSNPLPQSDSRRLFLTSVDSCAPLVRHFRV